MKKLLLLCIVATLFASPALAGKEERQERKEDRRTDALTELKTDEIESVDFELGRLNRLRSCLNSAGSTKQVHQCKESYRNQTYEKKQNRIDRQQDKIENQQERLDQRMQKLNDRELKLNQ